jgi:hypothetical protein
VQTSSGDLEPCRPSEFKVFSSSTFSPMWALAVNLLGLLTAILSFPFKSYVHMTVEGTGHPLGCVEDSSPVGEPGKCF